MTDWAVISEIFNGCAVLLTALAAWCSLSAFLPDKQPALRQLLLRAWVIARNNRLKLLSQVLVVEAVRAHDRFVNAVRVAVLSNWGLAVYAIASLVSFRLGSRHLDLSVYSWTPVALMLLLGVVVAKSRITTENRPLRGWIDTGLWATFVVYAWAGHWQLVNAALALPESQTRFAAIAVLVPLTGAIAAYGVVVVDSIVDALALDIDPMRFAISFVAIGVAVGVSLFVTMAALHFGSVFGHQEVDGYTSQLFASNAVCDGLTLFVTVSLLRRIQVTGSIRLLIETIVIDLAAAVALAMASLWFGLLGTKNALSISSVFCVFIGAGDGCQAIELGPYFWVMQTALLPTIAYLTLIGVGVLARAIIHATERHLLRALNPDINAFGYTSALLAVLAALSAVMAKIAEWTTS